MRFLSLGKEITTSASQSGTPEAPILSQPAPLLVEIGTEELPASDLDYALHQLRARVPTWLDELRLAHGEIRVYGTPRRLVFFVADLSPNQPDLEQVIKGPPADRAFDSSGQPTKAGEGFARSKGVALADLQVREIDGGRYVTANVRQAGRPAGQVITESLPELVASLRFEKSMRWNSSNVAFSRPLRWLLALYGTGTQCQVVPFQYAGIQSGRITRGLRFIEPSVLDVQDPEDYFKKLAKLGIQLDPAERSKVILQQVQELAAGVNGAVPDDPGLLAEVTNLVETPTALLGSFDQSYLALPREVLISVMKKHQRYFPVLSASGALLPYFITVSNQPGNNGNNLDLVVEGNEHVIRARFSDAAFFVREDFKKPLQDYLPRLATLTFQAKLGSMLDKSKRIQALVSDLAPGFSLSEGQLSQAKRAAELCKADLATHMVVEMTSLQGIIGRYYALQAGENPDVAQAIFEHYLPRYTGDHTPAGKLGLLVGLADRLDTLVGLFAAGLAPSGNKDPFAQRRAALGLVQNLMAWDFDFDLRSALKAAARHLPIEAGQKTLDAVVEFVVERLRNLLLEQGYRYDVVDAVLAAQGYNVAGATRAVGELKHMGRAAGLEQHLTRLRPLCAHHQRCKRAVHGQYFPVQRAHRRRTLHSPDDRRIN